MIHSIIIHTTHRGTIKFTLRLGPCGREVTELGVVQDIPGVLEVPQVCEDNPDEPDFFGFPLHTVLGYKVYHTDNPHPARNKH